MCERKCPECGEPLSYVTADSWSCADCRTHFYGWFEFGEDLSIIAKYSNEPELRELDRECYARLSVAVKTIEDAPPPKRKKRVSLAKAYEEMLIREAGRDKTTNNATTVSNKGPKRVRIDRAKGVESSVLCAKRLLIYNETLLAVTRSKREGESNGNAAKPHGNATKPFEYHVQAILQRLRTQAGKASKKDKANARSYLSRARNKRSAEYAAAEERFNVASENVAN